MIIDQKKHWPYLEQQHGRIGQHKKHYPSWCAAYEESLCQIFENMYPYIPSNPAKVLDIGGGFSGISLLLDKAYGSFDLSIIDGLDDMPARARTYNSAIYGRDFLRANGFRGAIEYYAPSGAQHIKDKFDLVYSFAAWPFHIPVDEYMPLIRRACDQDTVFVIEVRREFLGQLPLKVIEEIYEEEKYKRLVCRLA